MRYCLKICFRYTKQYYLQRYQFSTESINNILVDKLGSITTIKINRPETRNSLDLKTLENLSNAITNFEDDSTSSIGILYGVGGNFCAGYDLKQIASNKENARQFLKTASDINLTNRVIKKPLIAAVSGYAVGFGMELALMCDLRVVEETAIIGLLNRRFGIPTIDGGTVRLQAMIGLHRALDLFLTGRGIDGKEILELGLATRLVACGTSLGQSINLAGSVLKYPQKSLNADRRSLYYATFESKTFSDATNFEKNSINDEILEECVYGARRFLSEGIGRHGKFQNILEPQKKDWEKEP